jgi:hypothetical protein
MKVMMSKQYLMLCNEQTRMQLEAVIKNIEFIEIHGLNLNGEKNFHVLVTPIIPSTTQEDGHSIGEVVDG